MKGKTLILSFILILTLMMGFAYLANDSTSGTALALNNLEVESPNACSLNVGIVGNGTVNVTQNALNAAPLSVGQNQAGFRAEIGPDNNYVELENSDILVRYEPYQTERETGLVDEFSIVDFILKSAGNSDQVGKNYFDAGARRGTLKSATLLKDTSSIKTIRLVWNSVENPSKEIIEEVSIYPNGKFLELKYIDNQYGLNIVDLGVPGGVKKGTHLAYGGDTWNRGYITHHEELETYKGSYYNRYPKDGVNDPIDGGSLNYHDHFIVGVYNPANGVGFGRVMRVADSSIVKLLLEPNEHRGLEFFPYPFYKPHAPFTGYLYAFSGGPSDLIQSGKNLADGKFGGDPYPCNTTVTLEAKPSSGWVFSKWGGDLGGSTNPKELLITGDHFVEATFADTRGPKVSGQDPAPNEKDVAVSRSVIFHVTDDGDGVDQSSIKLSVNGQNVTGNAVITGSPADYTVTYTPAVGLPYNSNVQVQIEACDLASSPNCMSPVSYSFDTEITETDAPIISDIKVIAGVDFATITWVTNEPATTQVNYGKTAAYGNMVFNDALLTTHKITLKDKALLANGPLDIQKLDPQQEYHYQITSIDGFNNVSKTNDATFTTQVNSSLVSDDFNTCGPINPMWEFVNPLADGNYDLDGSMVNIQVPAGQSHDAWIPTNETVRLMQPATAFDELEVKFESGTTVEGQMQGLIIEQDAENYLRINIQKQGGVPHLFIFGFETGPTWKKFRDLTLASAFENGPQYLRVKRNGDIYNVYYSNDGVGWNSAGSSFGKPLATTKIGVFAGNTAGNPAHTAKVDYFFNNSARIDPEDPNANYLPVSIEGEGVVNKNPTCGNPVQLTAIPENGWVFSHWSGSPINGQTNQVVNTSFSSGDAVTAHFVAEKDFSLTVNTIPNDGSGGSVTRQPDQALYKAGTNITLKAFPNTGWKFVEWGGAISGNNATTNFVINNDLTVSATFAKIPYSVNVTVEGNGEVNKSPAGPYFYSDQVTLTAKAADGWSFSHWSGDLSGFLNPGTLNIFGNQNVKAHFVQGKLNYKVFAPGVLAP